MTPALAYTIAGFGLGYLVLVATGAYFWVFK